MMNRPNLLSIAPFLQRLVAALLMCVMGACSSRAPGPGPGVDRPVPAPRLLGAFAAVAGALPAIDGLPVGSLSDLAFDGMSGRWVGASDDVRVPRLVWMDIALGARLDVVPTAVTRLSIAAGLPADTLTALDMEGLAIFPDGSFAVAHEGHIDRGGVARQPRLLLATRAGVITTVVRPRPHFTIDPSDPTLGVRHNLGLESLTRTPDGRLVSGLEQPLAQDGAVSDATRGGLVRLVEFVPGAAGGWAPGREWTYQLEPTASVADYGPVCEDGNNGLSAMLALSDAVLLAVERACLRGAGGAPAYNPVRLYEVSLQGADDVSALPSLVGHSPVPVGKRLVLDLADWRARLPPLFATLSNFEGIASGPPGPRGERTIMLVSDDNFRATQTTAFLWIALE